MQEPAPYRIFRGENISFHTHFHQQLEIIYCVSGMIPVMIAGIEYLLEQGDVAVVFPNQQHCYQTKNEKNEEYILLFYPNQVEQFFSEWICKVPKIPVVRKDVFPEFFQDIWKQFMEVYEENKELYMFQAYAGLIAAHILPQMTLEPIEDLELSQEGGQAILNYVNQHFKEMITLKLVAKELGFTPLSLSRFFQDVLGIGFVEHVNSLRISYAKRLLRSSESTVSEIGFFCGFQSKRTFFRNFQKMCEQTPNEYRESVRNK